MIRLEKCTKVYHPKKTNALTVLREIDLSIQEGEMVAIMGKSGSGKTTLLNMIGLLDEPTSGSIYYDEKKVSNLSESQRSHFRGDHIGIILQNFALLLEETVQKNIQLATYFCRKPRRLMYSLQAVMQRCGLVSMAKKKVKELSGGQMQRVAIARALITNPRIILADEPTGSLDTASAQEILSLLSALHQDGKTILIVTHDADVASVCEKTIYVVDGSIVSA